MSGTSEAIRWDPLGLEDVAALLDGVAAPWWIAGGRALDLFLGHETRGHADTDVAILRRDQRAFRERLRSWDVRVAHGGAFLPWPPDATVADPAHHEAWARETPDGPWRLELLMEEAAGPRWSYRRDARVGLRVADLGRRDERGRPYLRPEIVLLYKSKGTRPVDETDFRTAYPRLDAGARGWLHGALSIVDPAHRWLERMK